MVKSNTNKGHEMSNAAKYSITGTDIANVTLWAAVKALAAIRKEDRTDSTYVRRGTRAVAFACDWHGTVRPMYGANDSERHVVGAWDRKLA
jgi:hypothetical protein